MQKEPGQYEMPAERLVLTHEGGRLGDDRDLGQAVVVRTLFGKAKIRIVRESDQPRWLWPLFTVLVAGGITAAAWFWLGGSREAPALHSDVPELVPAPPAPPVIEIPATAPQPLPAHSAVEGQAAVTTQRGTGTKQTPPVAEKAVMPVSKDIAEPARQASAGKRGGESAAGPAHEPTHSERAKADTALPEAPGKSARAVKKEPLASAKPARDGEVASASTTPAESKAAKPVEKKESPSVSGEAMPARENGAAVPPATVGQPGTLNEPQP